MTANNTANTVSVLLGNGDGTFQAKMDYGTGSQPRSVAIGDLNGDGKPDLVVANNAPTSHSVSVLLGNGDGTFAPTVDYVAGGQPSFAAIGDLNGDGKPDLAIASAPDTVWVMVGNGDGSFGAKVGYQTGNYPSCVAIGDVTGDGKPDLVTSNAGDIRVSMLGGHGDGTFATSVNYYTPGYTQPGFVAIGDLNGDGKPDLALGSSGSNTGPRLSVMFGDGIGGFPGSVSLLPFKYVGSTSVAIADLNGDSNPDLVATESGSQSDTVAVLLGNGDGTFGAQMVNIVGFGPNSVAIGDLNGDGRPDLMVADYSADFNSSTVSVLLGRGDGTFKTYADYQAGVEPTGVALGDLNGDGHPDLAVANYAGSSSTVSVLLGNGDGTFAAKTEFATGYDPHAVAIVDLNGDGKPDLITANDNATASVLIGNGDGTFAAPVHYPAAYGAYSMAIGELNGDGKPDLVTVGLFSNSVSVLLGIGDGTFAPQVSYPVGNYPDPVAIGDVNSDGKPDLVVSNEGDNTLSVLPGNGDGTFGTRVDYPSGGQVTALALGDLNGDSKLDLVVAKSSSASRTVSVLLGSGDGTFATGVDYATGSIPAAIAIRDIDHDGRPDLVTTNQGGSTVSVLLGHGDGTFAPKMDFGAGYEPRELAIGDLDGDGRLDLVTGNPYSVSVLVNTSTNVLGVPNRGVEKISMALAYPNPARGMVPVEFVLPVSGNASLRLYDLAGRVVHALFSGRVPAGIHRVQWNASRVNPGVYFYELRVGERRMTERAIILR